MDANIHGMCQTVGINENSLNNNITIYPNPFSSSFIIKYEIRGNSKVKLELFNTTGEEVAQLFDGNKTLGAYQEEITTEQLADGIYILKLTVDNKTSYQKLVKLNKY